MTSNLNPPPALIRYSTPRPFSAAPSKLNVPIIPKVSYKAFETPDELRREMKGLEK